MSGGGSVSASLVDPSSAIAAYQQAADIIQQQYPTAAMYMQGALNSAARQSIDQNMLAQNAGMPFSDTALQSMNELRSFMGLKPYTREGEITTALQGVVDKLQNSSLSIGGYDQLYRPYLNEVDRIKDMAPGQDRTNAIQTLQTNLAKAVSDSKKELWGAEQLGLVMTRAATDLNVPWDQITASVKNKPKFDVSSESLASIPTNAGDRSAYPRIFGQPANPTSDYWAKEINDTYERVLQENPNATNLIQQLYNGGISPRDFHNADTALVSILGDLDNIVEDIPRKIPQDPGRAMTGEEIQKKLESMPEYQFQYQQGSKALERSQAARGELASGNALLEAQNFGQGLAQNTYQAHISNLANLAGINLPMVQQQQGLYGQSGQTQANLIAGVGQNKSDTIQNIAQSRASAFNKEGDAQLQAAMLNAQLKTGASMANAQMKQSGMAGMGQLAGSILGLIL